MTYTILNKENIEAYTPKYAVDIILPYINKNLTIWAPFSRDEHHYANYLRELGYKVINTHYEPKLQKGNDFLTYEPDFQFDIILDNPPFKDKTKWITKALSYNKPFGLFLPINSFGDNGIPNAFLDFNAEPQLLIPDKRTEFINQPQKGISFKTVYICKDLLPKQIVFTKINKNKNM